VTLYEVATGNRKEFNRGGWCVHIQPTANCSPAASDDRTVRIGGGKKLEKAGERRTSQYRVAGRPAGRPGCASNKKRAIRNHGDWFVKSRRDLRPATKSERATIKREENADYETGANRKNRPVSHVTQWPFLPWRRPQTEDARVCRFHERVECRFERPVRLRKRAFLSGTTVGIAQDCRAHPTDQK